MAEKESLKLIVVYDHNRNEYSISAHNQSADEAQRFVEQWNPQLIAGCSLILLDQVRRHSAVHGRDCRACRETVARSAHLEPQPQFIRRKE
ncbi:MAG: hypothetical protein WAQ52_13785 [Terriglobales bacterium]